MIKVGSAPLELDLSYLSRYLRHHGVQHRIIEENGEQSLLIQHEQLASKVADIMHRYRDDEQFRAYLSSQVSNQQVSIKLNPSVGYFRATPAQAPVIFVFIFFSLLVAWLTDLGQGGPVLRALLIINPFDIGVDLSSFAGRVDGLKATLASGQVWRLFSPDFLHFSIMHITFNLLMLWVLGGQLENRRGSVSFLWLAVFVSIISNVAQLLDEGYLFGGLSGVVYGLIGYCWIWRRHEPSIFLPDVLLKFSLVWLLIGYTPLTEWAGLGRMANSAHLYGLLAGLVWGQLTVLLEKKNTQGKQGE